MQRIDRVAYANGWRSRNPVEKLALAGTMLALALLLPIWPGCALVLVVMIAAALLGARIAPRTYLRAASPALLFLALSAASLSLSVVHDPQSGLSLRVSAAGVLVAAQVALRAVAALSCLLLVALTTPLPEIVSLLRRCRVPAEVIEVSLVIYHLLFSFFDTARRMAMAQEARLGYSTLRRSYQSSALLVASVLERSLSRARSLEMGLAARGFAGELRVLPITSKMSRVFLAITLSLGALICWISLCAGVPAS